MIIKKNLIIISALIAINLISVVSADTGLKWESKNKNIKGQIFGRINIQSGANYTDDNTNTITTNSDYLYYRRIRLGASGQIGPVSFKIEPDFAPYMETVSDGNVDFKDVWVGYQFKMAGIKHKFIVGNDQTPCGLEIQNSSRFTNHIERHGTLSSWCQGERSKGYRLLSSSKNWTTHLSYSVGEGKNSDTDLTHGTYGVRATYSPLVFNKKYKQWLHTGFMWGYNKTNGSDNDWGSSSTDASRFISSGPRLNISKTGEHKDATRYGIELAFGQGPLDVQYERMWMSVDGCGGDALSGGSCTSTSTEYDFSAWSHYVTASYFLPFGDGKKMRAYNPEKGRYERIKVSNAAMVAYRFGYQDYADAANNKTRGDIADHTFTFNYFFNSYHSVQVEYYRATFDFSDITNASDKGDVFQLNWRIDF
jgi:phosphate-selective porin